MNLCHNQFHAEGTCRGKWWYWQFLFNFNCQAWSALNIFNERFWNMKIQTNMPKLSEICETDKLPLKDMNISILFVKIQIWKSKEKREKWVLCKLENLMTNFKFLFQNHEVKITKKIGPDSPLQLRLVKQHGLVGELYKYWTTFCSFWSSTFIYPCRHCVIHLLF